MSIGVGTQGTQFNEQYIRDMAKKDMEEFERAHPSAKCETLEDLRDTTGKSFKTSDIEKLMEKYDSEAYAEYTKFAKTPDGARSRRGLNYLLKWQDKVKQSFKDGTSIGETAKGNNISQKNEDKLSAKAQNFLKNLRAKYGDYDFMVGNSTDDLKALSKSGSKEFSVIFSSAEIERMANDERFESPADFQIPLDAGQHASHAARYAEEKMQGVEGAVRMSKRICEENGFIRLGGNGENGTINKISITVGDDGGMKIFAELQKTSDKQRERIEKAREHKKAEDKKAHHKAEKKNPYEKDDKDSVKRTTIEASSEEEFIKKLKELNWNDVPDAHSGDRFNFKA